MSSISKDLFALAGRLAKWWNVALWIATGILAGRLQTADSSLEYGSRRAGPVAGSIFVSDVGQQHRDDEGS